MMMTVGTNVRQDDAMVFLLLSLHLVVAQLLQLICDDDEYLFLFLFLEECPDLALNAREREPCPAAVCPLSSLACV
ncbi:MAG: hypothetical protein J3R72DRAFT_437733 [Linnemannia gamsii]|nr:MAG: hypothetical protein J3R72DRAFT_437733 [Linnemannia gamsii]